MSLMDWNDKLDIGVEKMNNEHKNLLNIMNKLFDLYEHKASYLEQKKYLDQLRDATVAHFKNEESYMESLNFEGIKQHKIIHTQLISKFLSHYSDFESKKEFSDQFFQFLTLWLNAHIQGIDKKYGECAQTKKAG